MEMLPQETARFLYASLLRGRHHCEKMKKRNVKRGRLLLSNCHEPPEMSISDMEGDQGSNILYICRRSACHHHISCLPTLSIYLSGHLKFGTQYLCSAVQSMK